MENGRGSPEPPPAPPAAATTAAATAESETPPPPSQPAATAPQQQQQQQPPPPAAPASGTGAASAAPAPRKRSGESAEDGAAAKRPRVDPNERATPLTPDMACLRTVELIESSLHKLKREVKAIDLLARQKEKEWDSLLKLRKAKEETFQRLRRKREVLLMQQSDETASVAQRVPAGPSSGGSGSAAAALASPVSAASSLVQQQLQQHKQKQQQQQQAQRAAAAAAVLSAQSAHGLRPIRPAYGGAGGRLGQGMGPQGPTISVQHLIDRHAADFRRRSELAVPLPASASPASQQDPQYREMLAQIAKLSKAPSSAAAAAVASVAGGTGEVTIHQVGAPTGDASGAQPQSSLASVFVGAMALETMIRQDRPNIAIKVNARLIVWFDSIVLLSRNIFLRRTLFPHYPERQG